MFVIYSFYLHYTSLDRCNKIQSLCRCEMAWKSFFVACREITYHRDPTSLLAQYMSYGATVQMTSLRHRLPILWAIDARKKVQFYFVSRASSSFDTVEKQQTTTHKTTDAVHCGGYGKFGKEWNLYFWQLYDRRSNAQQIAISDLPRPRSRFTSNRTVISEHPSCWWNCRMTSVVHVSKIWRVNRLRP